LETVSASDGSQAELTIEFDGAFTVGDAQALSRTNSRGLLQPLDYQSL